MSTAPQIGFIGQGFVGKSYADDFEQRGYTVLRFALEEPYVQNKDAIASCEVVFIAVPTPTTPQGFDDSVLRSVLPLVGKGKTAVIKSTLVPGTTDKLQEAFPDIHILFSPEFLIARQAAQDAARPILNIIGVPQRKPELKKRAEEILAYLPQSPHTQIMLASEAELFKYIHNLHGYFRIIFANLMYDTAEKLGGNWEEIKKAMDADPFMNVQANYYNNPVHQSGRGAGGACFIKDFAAFRELYEKLHADDTDGMALLRAMEQKNYKLLKNTGKDLDLLKGVYGEPA